MQHEGFEIHVVIGQIVVDRIVLSGLQGQRHPGPERTQLFKIQGGVALELGQQFVRHLGQLIGQLVDAGISGKGEKQITSLEGA